MIEVFDNVVYFYCTFCEEKITYKALYIAASCRTCKKIKIYTNKKEEMECTTEKTYVEL